MRFFLVLGLILGAAGPLVLGALREQFAWKQVDFTYESEDKRQAAIESGAYNPKTALPLGIARYKDRLFISLPKWKTGTPATLTTISLSEAEGNRSPLLNPYPSWGWHGREEGNCDGLTSVFRMDIDQCGRMWVLDSGLEKVAEGGKQVCPPSLQIFDLNTDTLLRKHVFPKTALKDNTFLASITVDVDGTQCQSQEDDAFAYLADIWGFGLVVYSFKKDHSYRVEHEYFHLDPLGCNFNATGLEFRWLDGIFGIALSPLNKDDPTAVRTMYFHPMSSFREFSVPTSVIRNETAASNSENAFTAYDVRGHKYSQASASSMSSQGILFYNLVSMDAVGCWNTRLPHIAKLNGVVDKNSETLSLPNDIKVDMDDNIWVLSDRLHKYLYKELNPEDYNFRVMTATVADAVRGTVCDPSHVVDPALLNPVKPECRTDL